MKLFDTDILIAHLRRVEPAVRLVHEAVETGVAVCSVMSRVEILGGMRSHERGDVRRLFSVLRMEPASDAIADRAGDFLRRHRRSHPGIGVPDYVIAATADVLGAELLTLNVRHYPMFEGLEPAF